MFLVRRRVRARRQRVAATGAAGLAAVAAFLWAALGRLLRAVDRLAAAALAVVLERLSGWLAAGASGLRRRPPGERLGIWLAEHPAVEHVARRLRLFDGPLPGHPVGVTGEPAGAWLHHGNLAIRGCLVMAMGLFAAGTVAAARYEEPPADATAMPIVTDEALGLPAAPAAAAGPAATAAPAAPAATPPAAPVPTPPPPAPVPEGVPARAGALPVGKGMWIWMEERADGGNIDLLLRRAQDVGLTHIYVRTGSPKTGFDAAGYLDQLLPRAHAVGIRIFAWDFPWLEDWRADADRGLAAIRYTTPDGHRIDGFAADVETRSEGVSLSPSAALAYGTALRQGVGYGYPLIAVVPRAVDPSTTHYPYPHVVAQFDAIAPMVYWLGREPGDDVARTIRHLSMFNKPILPVGQAYDGAPEGGPPGVPSRMAIHRFMGVAEQWGATGVSFWSWQHADQEAWDAIRDAPWFRVPTGPNLNEGQIRLLQTLLTSLGFATPSTGAWDQETIKALAAYQKAAGLPSHGRLDERTRQRLLTPFAPPVRPLN